MSVLDLPLRQVTVGRWPPGPRPQLSHALAAVAATTVDEAERQVLDRYREGEDRKARRVRRAAGPPPRCSACHRFKASHGGPCGSCGYTPGRGYA